MTTKKTPSKPKKPKPKPKPKAEVKKPKQKLLDYDPKTVTYDPETLATGKTLKKQNKQKRVFPPATPVTVPAEDVVVIEVVRFQGDRKPCQYAIPKARLGKAVPGIGRVVSVELVK